ncbi:MAG: GntR family transcriptional regulator, partial [Lactobacillus sp.]|nr:GntR family transcriptional regulator [Lactobacillus sp.]
MEKYSKQPIYLKLVAFLKNYIQNNMKKDQKLLSERDISLRLKISRYTVRRALDELEKRGYIYKIHGKGTFVSEKSSLTPLNDIYSFTDHMKA